jgi:hypothetical protein
VNDIRISRNVFSRGKSGLGHNSKITLAKKNRDNEYAVNTYDNRTGQSRANALALDRSSIGNYEIENTYTSLTPNNLGSNLITRNHSM